MSHLPTSFEGESMGFVEGAVWIVGLICGTVAVISIAAAWADRVKRK